MATDNNNQNAKPLYIYNIPYMEKKQLCRILDMNDDWKDLGGIHMGYSVFDIQEIENHARRCSSSPTSMLLERWGQQNHNVLELFVLLVYYKHIPALNCIKSLVDPKYHRLIEPTEENGNTTCSNRSKPSTNAASNTSNDVPVLVKYIEQGVKIESSSKVLNGPPYQTTKTSNETKSSATSEGTVAESAGALLMIPYAQLADATQDWHPSNILGKGGFGVVYKGDWKHTAVAIKRLKSPSGSIGSPFPHTSAESLRELKYLNACRHDNVLPLYGYSVDGNMSCLVYQLMSGGSLEDRLKCKNGQPPLPWKQRLRIAQGVAKGLQFLHTVSKVPLIHGDIKSANILLDTCGEPRIGDFGLAREGPNMNELTHMIVSRVHGTRPYLPDEFRTERCLSTKVDTYSFGVVLFELVSGQGPYDVRRHHKFLKDHVVEYCKEHRTNIAGLQDARLVRIGESDPDMCQKLVIVGIKCVRTLAADRPQMVEVWKELIAIATVAPNIPQH